MGVEIRVYAWEFFGHNFQAKCSRKISVMTGKANTVIEYYFL